MHRTLMSAYPDQPGLSTYRQAHGVLWRIDPARTAVTQLVQSATRPDWSRLPEGHVARAPERQSMRQVLDALTPGRRFAFRLLANLTQFSRTAAESPKRLPHRTTEGQVTWLSRANSWNSPACAGNGKRAEANTGATVPPWSASGTGRGGVCSTTRTPVACTAFPEIHS
ncbi:type I-E CRISPR-associated protein Cas6/Cse3/CasE [Actinokineospora sp. PR83]|nr:type I-E CRISPR-associated protein Cas6/Cse3/CasE [Actinokineospora sp. PR83]